MEQIKWVFENMKGSRWKFFLGSFIHIFINLPLIIIAPLFITRLLDLLTARGDMSSAHFLILMFLVASLIRGTAQYLVGLLLDSSAADCLVTMRTKLYAKLQSLASDFYHSTRTGDIMMRLTGDLEAMRHFIVWVCINAVYAVIVYIAGMAVFYCTNAVLAAILTAVSPVTTILVMRMRKQTGPAYGRVREAVSRLNTTVQENISGNRVVKAFVREDYEQKKFEERNSAFCEASVGAASIYAHYGPILNALSNAAIVLVLIVGGILVINEEMTVGQLFLFFTLNWLINDATRTIGLVINDGQRFFWSTQKVMQLYYARTDIKNPMNPYFEDLADGQTKERGQVEFLDVEFKYDRKPVLRGINITAQPGQTIGIMGQTGSGKTTLVMLLARFMDVTKGSIKIDGVDVRDYDLHTLRGKIGIAMQDVFLFSNSIDANIAYGRPDMSEDEVCAYAAMADADGFVTHMPNGYATIVGERGVGLSGGQKQRLALARALAYDAPVLVLDDTTSAVDMETEKYIQGQLANRPGRRTTFIIAQRISSVKDADVIYIINDGVVTEKGTHQQLLAKKGYYYEVYCLQQGTGFENEAEGANVYA